MRICLMTSTFPRWVGDEAPPFIFNLAQDLTARGWDVDVLAPHAPGAAQHETIGRIGVLRFRYLIPESLQTLCYEGGIMPKLRKRPWIAVQIPFLILGQWLALRKHIAKRRYDLIHAHWILPQGLVAVMAAKPRRIPVVVTVHGTDAFALRSTPLQLVKRIALKHAAAITANSTATANAIQRIAPTSASPHIIPFGAVSSSEANPLFGGMHPCDGPKLIFVGRLVEEKGVDDLLRAVALLSDLPALSLVVVGDGPERENLESMAASLGIAERVRFLGWLQSAEVARYMRLMEIFVGPSRTSRWGGVEAQGVVFAEALLAGLNVIATRSGGIPDTVIHEETGLLVDESAPDQIASQIRRLWQEPALAEKLRRNGNAFARAHLTRDRTADAFDELYRSLLGSMPALRSACSPGGEVASSDDSACVFDRL